MKKRTNNIRIFAVNSNNTHGFDIYLDFSGQKEYLIHHRHNGLFFGILKDGIYLEDMKRWKPNAAVKNPNRRSRSNASEQLQSMMKHLLLVVEDYILERESYEEMVA